MPDRTILHVDMDAFFAAIEQLDRPELRGRPVLIGSDGPRGVVATASYEARPAGCHSAQPMAIARRRCPDAVIVKPRSDRYREVSGQLFAILEHFSPRVEPLSIDEAFLDLTGVPGDPPELGRKLKQTIRDQLSLTASIGIAPNKFLAKVASEMDKPDGMTIIRPDDVEALLRELPVGDIPGIGPASAPKLQALGVTTAAELAALPEATVHRRFGAAGRHWHRLACGEDPRPVTPDRAAKSIGEEQTFREDISDPDALRFTLLRHVETVARRLRRSEAHAGNVTVKIRYGDFKTITRSRQLNTPTDTTDEIWAATRELFDQWWAKNNRPVRLLGATAGQLQRGDHQLGLFGAGEHERSREIDTAMDQIKDRFGGDAIRRGGATEAEGSAEGGSEAGA
ncbi:MAG: DNA polymerase IV [Phycisphaeraceae bacterium]|nr:DNA polymerase IV [Phycisphaeraceae bacterium]